MSVWGFAASAPEASPARDPLPAVESRIHPLVHRHLLAPPPSGQDWAIGIIRRHAAPWRGRRHRLAAVVHAAVAAISPDGARARRDPAAGHAAVVVERRA